MRSSHEDYRKRQRGDYDWLKIERLALAFRTNSAYALDGLVSNMFWPAPPLVGGPVAVGPPAQLLVGSGNSLAQTDIYPIDRLDTDRNCKPSDFLGRAMIQIHRRRSDGTRGIPSQPS